MVYPWIRVKLAPDAKATLIKTKRSKCEHFRSERYIVKVIARPCLDVSGEIPLLQHHILLRTAPPSLLVSSGKAAGCFLCVYRAGSGVDWPPSFGVYRLGMGPQPIVLYLATEGYFCCCCLILPDIVLVPSRGKCVFVCVPAAECHWCIGFKKLHGTTLN